MSDPFSYPAMPHERRHGPQGYADYASFRPWLRDEFSFRCVYCLLREQWGRVRGAYAIDHFLAVAYHPAKVTDYDNLLFACAACNTAKGDRAVPDPLVVLTSPAVHVAENGTIHADSPEAAPLPAGLAATAYRRQLTLGPTDRVTPLAAPNNAVAVSDLLP